MQMETGQTILTRFLPKTGQTISYRTGDDGYYEKGWWEDLLTDDNLNRFIDKTLEGDAVVIDRATGLMFPADGQSAGCNNDAGLANWEDAIDYCNALDFAGFTDWRLPNLQELGSILRMHVGISRHIYSNWSNISVFNYWTSTTDSNDDTQAILILFNTGRTGATFKSVSGKRLMAVRSV